MIIGSCLIFFLVVLYKQGKLPKVANPLTPRDPFEMAFQAIEAEAKRKAAGIIGGTLADHSAKEMVIRFKEAFASSEEADPKAPSA